MCPRIWGAVLGGAHVASNAVEAKTRPVRLGKRTPIGAETETMPFVVAQQGEYLTTARGTRLRDTDHPHKAGTHGPVLPQEHHFRAKIAHFDHERIPERMVHARGAAAHGVFEANGASEKITTVAFLRDSVTTPASRNFSLRWIRA